MNESIEIRDRIKIVREKLGLSQADFGIKLSLKRSAISLIERKRRNATERFIKDICREFGVDYMWLTTGDGEMFVESDDDLTETIDRIMAGENEFHKNFFKLVARMRTEDLKALERIIDDAAKMTTEDL